jgi:hypothetical protein
MGMHFACQDISGRRYGYGGAGQHITVRSISTVGGAYVNGLSIFLLGFSKMRY